MESMTTNSTNRQSHLKRLPQSFASLCVETVFPQIQRRDTRIHLPQNTEKKKGKSSGLSGSWRARAMTMNIGLTSRDLAIAFPPSEPNVLLNKLSVVSVVFTCVGVQENTNEKLAVIEREMTMNIGLTSRAFPRALPASASSRLFLRFNSVMLVFTCTKKMHAQQQCNNGCHGESVDTKSENHLEALGQSFAAFWAKLVVPQIQTGQRIVYLHGKTASTREKHKHRHSKS